jgi:hypothetical protein
MTRTSSPRVDNYLARHLHGSSHDDHNVQHDFNRLVNGARKGLRLKNASAIEPVSLDQDYDLFFLVAWARAGSPLSGAPRSVRFCFTARAFRGFPHIRAPLAR